MKNKSVVLTVVFGCIATIAAQSAFAQEVKATPLGSHDGELYPQDRALIFEDPNGTRIFFTTAARSPARQTLGSARSTSFSSATCMATTLATHIARPLTRVPGKAPTCRCWRCRIRIR